MTSCFACLRHVQIHHNLLLSFLDIHAMVHSICRALTHAWSSWCALLRQAPYTCHASHDHVALAPCCRPSQPLVLVGHSSPQCVPCSGQWLKRFMPARHAQASAPGQLRSCAFLTTALLLAFGKCFRRYAPQACLGIPLTVGLATRATG